MYMNYEINHLCECDINKSMFFSTKGMKWMHFIHQRRGIIGPKSWAKGKDQKVRKKCMLIYKKIILILIVKICLIITKEFQR